MSATESIPSIEALQAWAKNPIAAFDHLSELLACLSRDSEEADWATEALENCGIPPVEALDLLLASLRSKSPDVVYWSCKLIGRMQRSDRKIEDSLVPLLADPHVSAAVKRQAIAALAHCRPLHVKSTAVLEQLVASNDASLSTYAREALEG